MKQKNKYSKSEAKLRNYLANEERQRRSWANEKWFHDDGRFSQFGRLAVPVLSAIGIFLMFIVCLVRFANIPAVNIALANNGVGTSTLTKDDPFIIPFFVLTLILFNLLVYGAVCFIKKKYERGTYVTAVSSLLLCLFAFIRRGADSGLFPDNSDYDGGPIFTYFEYCIFSAIVFGLIFAYMAILLIIFIKDRKAINDIVDRTIIKIIPQENKTLLSEDDYSKLIDEYIENQNNKKNRNKNHKVGDSKIYKDSL